MSKMIKCKTCGAEIASSAKICPSCGAKNKKPFYTKWWFWVIVIIICAAAIGGGSESSNTTNSSDKVVTDTISNADTNVAKESDVEEVIIVSAEELAKAFEDNEISANKQYKDKMLEITGTVYNIGEMLGDTYIVLASGEEFAITQTQCSFKDEDQINKVAELAKGDKVTVIGKCTGKSMNVGVNDCKFK